ncbi:MAG: hypothetical protein R3306_11185, partial [Arenibacter algicola]|nr:hypothetical protein [Arenibacter algicola]
KFKPLSSLDQNKDNDCIFWIPTFCTYHSIWFYSRAEPFLLKPLFAPFLKLFLAFFQPFCPVSFFCPLEIRIITGQKYLF